MSAKLDSAPFEGPEPATVALQHLRLDERLRILEHEVSNRKAGTGAVAQQSVIRAITRELIDMANALPNRALRRLDIEDITMLTALVGAEYSER